MFVFCVYAFFNVIIFQYGWGSQGYLGVSVKILEFAGMLFVYLKISSKKARQDRLFITTLSVNTCRYYTYNIYQSIYLYNIYTSAVLIAYNLFFLYDDPKF